MKISIMWVFILVFLTSCAGDKPSTDLGVRTIEYTNNDVVVGVYQVQWIQILPVDVSYFCAGNEYVEISLGCATAMFTPGKGTIYTPEITEDHNAETLGHEFMHIVFGKGHEKVIPTVGVPVDVVTVDCSVSSNITSWHDLDVPIIGHQIAECFK